jgi:hypothetical protein
MEITIEHEKPRYEPSTDSTRRANAGTVDLRLRIYGVIDESDLKLVSELVIGALKDVAFNCEQIIWRIRRGE